MRREYITASNQKPQYHSASRWLRGRLATSNQLGVSLLEILIVIGVITLLSVLSFVALHNLQAKKALDTESSLILGEIQKARSLTLSSKDKAQYGVHFTSSGMTLFKGASYVAGAAGNIVSTFNSSVTISSIALQGGGADVIFDRLTGKTPQSGTLTVRLRSGATKTITVYPTGLVQIQ